MKIEQTSLEDEEKNLEGEEKKVFVQFLKKMVQWRSKDRLSAKELMALTRCLTHAVLPSAPMIRGTDLEVEQPELEN